MADDTPLEWVLLYDGPCGLCQASVQWLMRRDRHQVLRYTSLQSVWAAEWSAHSGVALPADSVAIIFGNRLWQGPEVLWKSLELLPAPWPIFARIGRLVPGQKKCTDGSRDIGTLYLVKKNRLQRAQYQVHGTNRVRTLIKGCLFGVIQFVVHDFLPAILTDHHRNS